MDKLNNDIDNLNRCPNEKLDENLLEKISRDKPTEDMIKDLAELFKVFGDPTRVKIIYALFESEMCVFHIAELLNMSQSAISHQLSVLKKARLVKNRKEGKTVYYSLDDEHIKLIFNYGLSHIKETYY